MTVTTVLLSPGEYFVGDASHRVRTLLGSCVSITLWHPQQRFGAMSHFLLGERPVRQGDGTPKELDARYGTEALALMVQGLAEQGIQPHDCQAKVFGGANMFPRQTRGRPQQVGQRNGDAATAMLARLGVPVTSSALYGFGHREIVFDIATGDVWSRQVHIAREDDTDTTAPPSMPGELE